MKPYQSRVVSEKKELDEKIAKLWTFIFEDDKIFSNLPEDERLRLARQFRHMSDYARVLEERIAAFI